MFGLWVRKDRNTKKFMMTGVAGTLLCYLLSCRHEQNRNFVFAVAAFTHKKNDDTTHKQFNAAAIVDNR